MTFATDITAIYAGRGAGKTTLARKLVAKARLPQVVYIDPVARDGFSRAGDVLAQIEAGARAVVLRAPDRAECLRTIYATALASTRLRPLFLVCDEAPLYLDKPTDPLRKIMYQGRHRGLGMLILSQRPTAIAAAVRSQASVTHWGRITDHVDMALAAQTLGHARARGLSSARPGQFIRHPE